MKTWPILSLACACFLSAGCRQDPYLSATFEMMNQEKRHLEDRVYELEDELDQFQDQLESARRENNKLRKLEGSEEEPSRPKRGSILPRSSDPPRNGAPKDPREPKIEFGEPGEPERAVPGGGGARPRPAKMPAKLGPEMNGPNMNGPAGKNDLPPPAEFEGEQTAYVEPEDTRVTHIILNPFLTGGHDFDHKAGDDGVAVIVEPRNKEDQFVQQAGPVSIVVIDPEIEGKEGRIARWDFDSIEVGKLMKKKGLGRGIHFKLPWPNKPPENNKLKVFVRYQTLDGRKLEADRDITIAKLGQFSQRWTPRPLDASVLGGSAGTSTSVLVGHTEDAGERLISKKKPSPSGDTARRPMWSPNR